eukprot:403344155
MVIFMAKYGKYIVDEVNHYLHQEELLSQINLSESIKKQKLENHLQNSNNNNDPDSKASSITKSTSPFLENQNKKERKKLQKKLKNDHLLLPDEESENLYNEKESPVKQLTNNPKSPIKIANLSDKIHEVDDEEEDEYDSRDDGDEDSEQSDSDQQLPTNLAKKKRYYYDDDDTYVYGQVQKQKRSNDQSQDDDEDMLDENQYEFQEDELAMYLNDDFNEQMLNDEEEVEESIVQSTQIGVEKIILISFKTSIIVMFNKTQSIVMMIKPNCQIKTKNRCFQRVQQKMRIQYRLKQRHNNKLNCRTILLMLNKISNTLNHIPFFKVNQDFNENKLSKLQNDQIDNDPDELCSEDTLDENRQVD